MTPRLGKDGQGARRSGMRHLRRHVRGYLQRRKRAVDALVLVPVLGSAAVVTGMLLVRGGDGGSCRTRDQSKRAMGVRRGHPPAGHHGAKDQRAGEDENDGCASGHERALRPAGAAFPLARSEARYSTFSRTRLGDASPTRASSFKLAP